MLFIVFYLPKGYSKFYITFRGYATFAEAKCAEGRAAPAAKRISAVICRFPVLNILFLCKKNAMQGFLNNIFAKIKTMTLFNTRQKKV